MPSRNDILRAREQLESAAPICDEDSLMKLQEDVAELIREATLNDASKADQLPSNIIDEVARKYFEHILRQQARITSSRRQRSP